VTELHNVVLFLDLMKRTAREEFVFVGRRTNLEALALLGITREHAESLVRALKPEGYVAGPKHDQNNTGLDMWIFGLHVSSREIYVKLQIVVEPARCVCVSFHVAEHPMHYPFRETQPPDSKGKQ